MNDFEKLRVGTIRNNGRRRRELKKLRKQAIRERVQLRQALR